MNNNEDFIDLTKKNDNSNINGSQYPNNNQQQFQNTTNGYTQPFPQNTNNQPFFDYNNTNNNNYQQNPYQPNQNIYPQQPPQPQPDYNRQYADPPKKKTSSGMYIILIAVIVFFAVIIVAMSTIMKAMVNKKNNNNDNLRGNTTLSDSTDDDDEDSEDETEDSDSEEMLTTTNPVMAEEVTEVTEPIETEPEVVTVTVIVEVPAEPEPEHYDPPVQNQTYVYDTGFYGYITTQKDPLNVRSEPSKSSKVLTSIPKGEYVYVYDTSEYGWYYTTYNGKSGYVSADYVTAGQYSVYDSYTPSTAVVATKQDVLNLRKSASTNGTIITGIPKGSTVTIVEYGYDWCYVSWGGYTGYVSTDYLSF